MARSYWIWVLTIISVYCGNTKGSSGNISPMQREWSGNSIVATPINGLEMSTYSFCIHVDNPAKWLFIKFPH